MKDGGTLNGGSVQSSLVDVCEEDSTSLEDCSLNQWLDAKYLLNCLQGFKSKGIIAYAISVLNEPQNVNPTFPTAKLTPAMEGQIGTKLRTLINSNGFSKTKLIGQSSVYPILSPLTFVRLWAQLGFGIYLPSPIDASGWCCLWWGSFSLLWGKSNRLRRKRTLTTTQDAGYLVS